MLVLILLASQELALNTQPCPTASADLSPFENVSYKIPKNLKTLLSHLPDFAVVSVLGLLLKALPLLQHLVVGERDAVDTLESLHV